MKRSLFMACLVTALMTGCKKNETAATSSTTPSEGQPAVASTDNSSTPTPPEGAPVTIPTATPDSTPVPAAENGNMSATLGALTLRVRSYVVSTHKVPQTFEEFVAANPNLQIPPPPAGKKYAFDHKMHVILVNR